MFQPFAAGYPRGTEVRLLRERDCKFNIVHSKTIMLMISIVEHFSGFQKATQEILQVVPEKAQALVL